MSSLAPSLTTGLLPNTLRQVFDPAVPALFSPGTDIIKQSVAGELAWLNTSLLELWEDRGPYPGLASVLHDLGCARAVEIQQRALADLVAAGEDIAEVPEMYVAVALSRVYGVHL